MGTGYLTIQALTGDDALPVAKVLVTIKRADGVALYETDTDANGNTGRYSITAPDVQYTLDPHLSKPAYSVCNAATGYVTKHIHGVVIVDTLSGGPARPLSKPAPCHG